MAQAPGVAVARALPGVVGAARDGAAGRPPRRAEHSWSFLLPVGAASVGASNVESLRRVGVRTSIRNVPTQISTDVPGHSQHLGLEVYDVSLIHVQPEPLFRSAYARAGLAERPGVYRVGLWYWELETVRRSGRASQRRLMKSGRPRALSLRPSLG